MENSVEVPQKNKNKLPYDLEILLLGIYPQKTKMLTQKDTCVPMFTAALFTIAKTWKQPKRPSEEWIERVWCVYIHTHAHIYIRKYYSAIRKNEIMPFAATRMDPEMIVLSQVS